MESHVATARHTMFREACDAVIGQYSENEPAEVARSARRPAESGSSNARRKKKKRDGSDQIESRHRFSRIESKNIFKGEKD